VARISPFPRRTVGRIPGQSQAVSCQPAGRKPAGPAALALAACHDAGVTEQRFDLVVRNGTIVTPGHREQANVGITGGRIAQLGGTMTGAGEIDAGGLLVIPGGIDAHVHLMCAQVAAAEPGEPTWADDFWTGSLMSPGHAEKMNLRQVPCSASLVTERGEPRAPSQPRAGEIGVISRMGHRASAAEQRQPL
jgi:hypothetical protein